MNENTTKLLEKLAEKLGTTSEYLWSVLLKQAPIDATVGLIQLIIVCVVIYLLYKLHIKFMGDMPSDENNNYTQSYYNSSDGYIAMMVVAGIVVTIFLIICVCSIGSIVSGYFHPEYWALHEILGQVSK